MNNKMVNKIVLGHMFCYGDGDDVPPPVKVDPPALDPSTIGLDFVPTDPNAAVNLTQADLDKIIGGIRVKSKKTVDELGTKINDLTKTVTMTKEERDRLDGLLTQSKSEFGSQLDQTKAELTRTKGELAAIKEASEKQTSEWKQRYEVTLVDQAVAQACAEFSAYDPSQMRDLLDRHLTVVEKMDNEGKGTGVFNAVVKDKDEKGELLHVDVKDYMKKMSESAKFSNLFKHGVKEGLHTNNGGSGATGGNEAPVGDPVALAKWLENPANREAFMKRPVNK